MAQQALRPAWCGSWSFEQKYHGSDIWLVNQDASWRVFCCEECQTARHRVGWHRKPIARLNFTGMDWGANVEHIDRDDLAAERAASLKERNRLARRVNQLLGKLRELESQHESACLGEELLKQEHRAEIKRLNRALEDLGAKNDALTMDKAELVGEIAEMKQERDEESAHNAKLGMEAFDKRQELYRQIFRHELAIQDLTAFVFHVLEQHAQSQQQLAQNK